MIEKRYQRRYLRAPYREAVLFGDGTAVYRARGLNISAGGVFLSDLQCFPDCDEISMLLPLPMLPILRDFSLRELRGFSPEFVERHVFRAQGRMVQRAELIRKTANLIGAKVGIEFSRIEVQDQVYLEDYVSAFAANIIYLQTLIDSFNSDQEAREKTRRLAAILGYQELERISQLRTEVANDYKNLQWL